MSRPLNLSVFAVAGLCALAGTAAEAAPKSANPSHAIDVATVKHPDGETRGRSTIWLHPSIPLRFVFDDPEPTELNRAWIEELAQSASSSGGIQLTEEQIESVDGDADNAPQTVAVADD